MIPDLSLQSITGCLQLVDAQEIESPPYFDDLRKL